MATRSFSFHVEQPSPRHCVIRMAGEFGPRSVPDLQTFLARRLGARPTRLVLDFSAVTSLSSQALAVLLAAKRRADAQGVRLYLVATDEAGAARILDMTGLARMFRTDNGRAPDSPAAAGQAVAGQAVAGQAVAGQAVAGQAVAGQIAVGADGG